MSPEQFEARAREGLKVKGEAPSAAHDAAILEAARNVGGEIRARRRAARRHFWVPLSVAAGVGVLAVGLWSTIDRSSQVHETVRGVSSAEVTPANGATLTSVPARLGWQEQPGAATYRVTLRAADARVIWHSDATANSEVAIPAQLSITVGATYFWSVDYEGPAASGSLGPYSFSIADQVH